MRNMPKMPAGLIGAPVILATAGIVGATVIGYNSLFTVEGGHAAVVYNRVSGIKDQIYGEGMHFRMPWLERAYVYNIRVTPKSIASSSGSKDLQTVNLTLRVLAKPTVRKLPTIYRELGHNWKDRVLPSITREIMKGVVAQFTAAQLITQRSRVSILIRDRLTERARDFNIELEDVSITDLNFSAQYARAIESKQVAQQDAERAKFVVEQAKQNKEKTIIDAEGEAKSAKLLSEQIKDKPDFLLLRRIQAAQEIATVLARSSNKIYLSSNQLLLSLLGSVGTPPNASTTHASARVPEREGQTEEILSEDVPSLSSVMLD